MHLNIYWGHPSGWKVYFIFNSASSDVCPSSTMSRVHPVVSFLTGSRSKIFWFSSMPAGWVLCVSEIHTSARENHWSFAPAALKERLTDQSPSWPMTTTAARKWSSHHRPNPLPQQGPDTPVGPGELTKKGIRPAALSLSRASCRAEARMANLSSEGMAFNLTPPIKPALSTEECACKKAPG